MPDEPDPPRKFYQLKQKEFEIVNAPSGAAAADGTPTHVRGHLRAAAEAPATAPLAPLPRRENDVHALLRDNLARANAAGLNDVAPTPPRRSRRKRDYWTLMILGNGTIVGLVLGLHVNVVSALFGLAGLVLLSVSLTWIMWFVMDDY